MCLAENIYRFRTEQNMSQLDLANALEVSRQSVSKWETGTAVPELDKLVKMATLFDVSLDALVNGEAPSGKEELTPAEVPEPKVIYIEKPVFPTVKRQYLIGTVILICALLYAIILYSGRFGMEETLFLVSPVAACGVVYLLAAHPLPWCGWVIAGGYWVHFFILFHRWEEHPFLIGLGVAVVAAVAFLTLRLRAKGILRIPSWAIVLGGGVLILLFILLCMNCVPFSFAISSEVSSTPIPK